MHKLLSLFMKAQSMKAFSYHPFLFASVLIAITKYLCAFSLNDLQD